MGFQHTCIACGQPFNVTPSQAARGAGMACSKACRQETIGFGKRIRDAMPDTVIGIAETTRVDVAVVRDNVKRLLRAGAAHVSGFEDRGPNTGRGTPRFECIISLGPQTDPEMPVSTRDAVTLHVRRLILAAMPARAQEIVEQLQFSVSTVTRMLEALHADEKCHVGGWFRPARGGPVPVYKAGQGKDKPCNIKNFTRAEVARRHVAKLKASGEWDVRASRIRSYYWKKKAAARGDTIVAALFGRNKVTPAPSKSA